VTDETRSHSGIRIDDRQWGRYVDIPLACPRNRERYRRALAAWTICRRRRAVPASPPPTTLAEIVSAYRREYQPGARAELVYYASLPSLREAVLRAARAERPNGKRHDHQTRIRRRALQQVQRVLGEATFRSFTNFQDLHEFLSAAIGTIPGIGELMVYDTALRIGAKLGVEPQAVYLHRGTRNGAGALGLDTGRPFIALNEFPSALQSLRPHAIEDCLCIYTEDLRTLATRRQAASWTSPSRGMRQ
jgi:hypothetical protein